MNSKFVQIRIQPLEITKVTCSQTCDSIRGGYLYFFIFNTRVPLSIRTSPVWRSVGKYLSGVDLHVFKYKAFLANSQPLKVASDKNFIGTQTE